MTELQNQFQEETKQSFEGIPINGLHLEYITWLEKQIQALRIHNVVGQSEQCAHTSSDIKTLRCNCCNDCGEILDVLD